jgi:hypothetical protein
MTEAGAEMTTVPGHDDAQCAAGRFEAYELPAPAGGLARIQRCIDCGHHVRTWTREPAPPPPPAPDLMVPARDRPRGPLLAPGRNRAQRIVVLDRW